MARLPEKHTAKPENHAESGDNGRDAQGRWKPGQSGNPQGRPPGLSLRSLIVDRLEECPEGLERSLGEELAVKVVADAIRHDGQSRKLVIEMIEGKARASLASTVEIVEPRAKPPVTEEQRMGFARAAIKAAEEAEKLEAYRAESARDIEAARAEDND